MRRWILLALFAGGCAHAPIQKPAPEPATEPATKQAPSQPTPRPVTPAQEVPRPIVRGRLRLAAVGDVIPHGEVLKAARARDRLDGRGRSENHAGFDDLMAGVRQDLTAADLVFANLETPVAPKTGKPTVPFLFNAPPALLEALQALKVGFVSVANNHVYDQARPGFEETLQHLEASGLTFAGAGRTCAEATAARRLTVGGFKLAFLAASALFNFRLNQKPSEACAAELDEARLLAAVTEARSQGAELVLLSLHWGNEYETVPRREDVELAHRLIDGGVDVILGHHPHVLQPIEVVQAADGRIGLVAYSLGNFLHNQARFYVHGLQREQTGNPRDGALLRFSALRVEYAPGVERIELGEIEALPLWSDNNALDRKPNRAPDIRVLVNDRALLQAQADLCSPRADRVSLLKRIALLLDRRRIAAGILGEDLVVPPPAPPACKEPPAPTPATPTPGGPREN